MNKDYLIFAAFASFGAIAHCEQASLCTAGELVAFTCAAGSKVISVCASPDATASHGYLQYRFGKPDHAELVFPTNQILPGAAFVFRSGTSASGATEQLEFKIGNFVYTVYSEHYGGIVEPKQDAGVIVERDNARVAHIKCTNPLAPAEMGIYIEQPHDSSIDWHSVGLPSNLIRNEIP